jgi:hypothetical protein
MHPWFAELIAPQSIEELQADEDERRSRSARRRRSRQVMTLRRAP